MLPCGIFPCRVGDSVIEWKWVEPSMKSLKSMLFRGFAWQWVTLIQYSVSLFDWPQFWNEVVYLEHLYEEKRMEDWAMAIRGVRRPSGLCLNIKTVFPRYGDSHVKDKTVLRLSYLKHWDLYTGKTTSLYWDSPPELMHFHWIECPGHLCVIFEFGITCCMMHICHHKLLPTSVGHLIQLSHAVVIPRLYKKWFMIIQQARLLELCYTGVLFNFIMNEATDMDYKWC